MISKIISYFPFYIPAMPFIMYFCLYIKFIKMMKDELPESLKKSEGYKNVSLTLVGIIFSMSGVFGILKDNLPRYSELLLYYVMFCLVCFLGVFFLQRFRRVFWHDILSDCLLDAGLLLIILSIGALFVFVVGHPLYIFIFAVACIFWFGYVFFHIRNYWSWLMAIKGG